jgi:hypothetical protein
VGVGRLMANHAGLGVLESRGISDLSAERFVVYQQSFTLCVRVKWTAGVYADLAGPLLGIEGYL